MLLRSFEDETVRRVAAGAIANLAMSGIIIFLFAFPSSKDLNTVSDVDPISFAFKITFV